MDRRTKGRSQGDVDDCTHIFGLLILKCMRRIYMDANATTPVLPEVLEAMRPFWSEEFGNASSIHQRGQHARAAVDRARESVGRLLNCRRR